jgi:hypothetical protein
MLKTIQVGAISVSGEKALLIDTASKAVIIT